MKLLVLDDEDVRKALPMQEAINVTAKSSSSLSSGEAVVPLRTIMMTPPLGGTGFMPAYCPGGSNPEDAALGLKIVSIRPNNPKEGLPTIPAQVFLVDPKTGRPLVLMDATYL